MLQLRPDQAEPAGVTLQLLGEGVGADPDGQNETGPRDHEAPRTDLVIVQLRDRDGLAAQERLIDLEPIGGKDQAVHDDLVAGPKLEHIVQHHVDRPAVRPSVRPVSRGRSEP